VTAKTTAEHLGRPLLPIKPQTDVDQQGIVIQRIGLNTISDNCWADAYLEE
jgi:hypothetical protein